MDAVTDIAKMLFDEQDKEYATITAAPPVANKEVSPPTAPASSASQAYLCEAEVTDVDGTGYTYRYVAFVKNAEELTFTQSGVLRTRPIGKLQLTGKQTQALRRILDA